MKEEWRQALHPRTGRLIDGYEVSNKGRVRSVFRFVHAAASTTRSAHIRCYSGQILRPGAKRSGHVSVVLGRSEGSFDVHALVVRAFIGPTPENQEIRHKDGDPIHNGLANLHFGSRSDNNRDTVFHGRRRVTVTMIRFIRAKRAKGWTLRRLSDIAGVCRSQVSNIVTRRHYAHVR